MVNFDVFIKYIRTNFPESKYTNWPELVNSMRFRLDEVKEGFPGIRSDHLELTNIKSIITKTDNDFRKSSKKEIIEYFIYDPYVYGQPAVDDYAPVMIKACIRPNNDIKFSIFGIGKSLDLSDPDRNIKSLNKEIDLEDFNENLPVYKVTVRPDVHGGPGYYYFFRAYKDQRI